MKLVGENALLTAINITKNVRNITYNELVVLRDNDLLIPGQKYRIIDYVTTVNQSIDYARSAGNRFDVIVTALSNNTLLDEASIDNCVVKNLNISAYVWEDVNSEFKKMLHVGDIYILGTRYLTYLTSESLDILYEAYYLFDENFKVGDSPVGMIFNGDHLNVYENNRNDFKVISILLDNTIIVLEQHPDESFQFHILTDTLHPNSINHIIGKIDLYGLYGDGNNYGMFGGLQSVTQYGCEKDEIYIERITHNDELVHNCLYCIGYLDYNLLFHRMSYDLLLESDDLMINFPLNQYKVWYSLDNNRRKYNFADDSYKGRGVIYRMIDDKGNDCPYDFLNIQYARYIPKQGGDHLNMVSRSSSFYNDLNYEFYDWFYTFSDEERNNLATQACYNNVIKGPCGKLPDIVLESDDCVWNNTFNDECRNITLHWPYDNKMKSCSDVHAQVSYCNLNELQQYYDTKALYYINYSFNPKTILWHDGELDIRDFVWREED